MELKRGEEIAQLKHDMDVAQLRRDYQLELERLKNQGTLSDEVRRQEQQRLDGEIAGNLRRADAELKQKLESERALFEAKITQRRESAQVDLDIEARKQNQLLEQARGSVEVYLDYKRGKQEIEHADRKLDFDFGQQEAANKHREKLETATTFDTLSMTTLIAMAPPEQAALLADLHKTETLSGMTEEQILALYAKDSPEIAKALAEKFKAAGSSEAEAKEKSEKLLERMLSEKDAWVKTVLEMHRDGIQAVKEIAQSAMNSQRDTARSAATPVFVQSGSPNYPYAAPPPPTQPLICGACRNASPAGSPFCHHCGHRA
jgi:hypothetical protein